MEVAITNMTDYGACEEEGREREGERERGEGGRKRQWEERVRRLAHNYRGSNQCTIAIA